jgi:LPXTG-motif cell wall-anchored protein
LAAVHPDVRERSRHRLPRRRVLPDQHGGLGRQRRTGYPHRSIGNGQVVFDLPDGRSIPAINTLATRGGNDFFSGDFYALVPADLASVKVVLAATMPASVESQTSFEQQATTITLSAPLTETVNFPPAWTPTADSAPTPAPGTPVTVPGPTKPKSKTGSTSPVLFVGLGLLVLLIAGSLAFAARRRAQTLPVTPVVWPPRQLSPAGMKALTRPLRALPAGSTVDAVDEAPSVTAPAQSGPAAVAPPVVVNLLGPPDIHGLARPITRTPVKRLLIVLVLNSERLVTADELAMAISGKADRAPKVSSLHSYARRSFGARFHRAPFLNRAAPATS